MEKILSFDVGIINLAYCLFTKKAYIENNKTVYKWDILEWDIINLTNRDEIKCCICNKVASLEQNNGVLKYYCKVHARAINCKPLPYEQFYIPCSKQIGGCQFPIDMQDNTICNKNCTMKDKNNNTFCNAHTKKLYQNLVNGMKLYVIKKMKVTSMDFDDTRMKLFHELESRKHLLEANVVVIENQPSLKNPRMKSISALLYDYYIIRGILDKEITKSAIKRVKFMSPSNKIKLASDGETQQIVKLKASNEAKAYKLTKSLAVKYSLELLAHLPDWIKHFNSFKKKDDLADSFLQGAYYFEMNIKLDDSPKKKRKTKEPSKKPLISINTMEI